MNKIITLRYITAALVLTLVQMAKAETSARINMIDEGSGVAIHSWSNDSTATLEIDEFNKVKRASARINNPKVGYRSVQKVVESEPAEYEVTLIQQSQTRLAP